MKIAVIGGVASTKILLEELGRAGFAEVHVWGYVPESVGSVSGWADLSGVCMEFSFGYSKYTSVQSCEPELRKFAPDVLFAVGLSQIVPSEMLNLARIGNVGFHPTRLPQGRGRAPLAWMVLDRVPGAATLFALAEGVDDGPILAQQPIAAAEEDDAEVLLQKALEAEREALRRWLPSLQRGEWEPQPQDHATATWYGKRTPADGLIDWTTSAESVVRLVRASTRPHPGAYTYVRNQRVRIWRARVDRSPIRGVPGRVVLVSSQGAFLVQAGDVLVQVLEWQAEAGDWAPKVGARLGYPTEDKIFEFGSRIEALESEVTALRRQLQGSGMKQFDDN